VFLWQIYGKLTNKQSDPGFAPQLGQTFFEFQLDKLDTSCLEWLLFKVWSLLKTWKQLKKKLFQPLSVFFFQLLLSFQQTPTLNKDI